MQASVLGPLRLVVGGEERAVPGGQVGSLLQLLLLRPGHPHRAGELVAALWGDRTDEAVGRRRLRVTLTRLRHLLADGTDEERGDDGLRVERQGDAYRLVASARSLDRLRFEEAAAAALATGDRAAIDEALASWTGTPYEGSAWPVESGLERSRLLALRQALVQARLTADGGIDRTKVHAPITTALHLDRDRLVGDLPPAGSGRSIVVVAPPGFGKSTVLAQWAARQQHAGWMALDPHDEDPTRIWALLHRSLVAAGLVGPDSSAEDLAPGALATALEGWPGALVIDDVHCIGQPEALEELALIVRSLLDLGTTVALGSRLPLPPGLDRAVGRAPVVLGAEDLRFTLPEVASLFPAVDGRRRSEAWQAVEGWPIGVVSLIRTGAEARPGRAGSDVESISSYLSHEVLAALDEDLSSFLLEIAALDEFSVSLCNAVTGRDDAAGALGRLRQHGLFLVETSGESDLDTGWYRLHHGVATELRRLARDRVDTDQVLRRAARWFHERGLKVAALRCATAGRERSVVAAVAGDVVLDAVFRREYLACLSLLRSIDPDDVAQDYRSHSICACVALIWLPQQDRARWMQSRTRRFGEDDVLVLMRGVQRALHEGRSGEAVVLSDRLLARIEEGIDPSVADLAPVFAGMAQAEHLRARIARADIGSDDPLFPQAMAAIRPFLPLVAAWIYADWALVALLEGNEALARSLAEEFHQIRVTTDVLSVPREKGLIGALVAGLDTDDSDRLAAIAAGLDDQMERVSLAGDWVRLAMLRLIAAHLNRRAGDDDSADRFAGLADSLIRTFEDAPFLDRMRDRLSLDTDPATAITSVLLLTLTRRQREVLPHLVTGAPLAEVAERLHISIHTLRGHLRSIYARLGVTSRAAAMARLSEVDVAKLVPPT